MSHDSQLQQAVLAELNWEPSVTAANIGVTAKSGVVALTGHVGSYVEKYAAETAARRVKGVKAVAEELEVRLPSDIERDDADIAEAALDRLAWDASVPNDTVKIKVESGLVTLTGEVDWHYQKTAAERDVGGMYKIRQTVREYAARCKAVLDIYVLHKQPHFLGEKIRPSPLSSCFWRESSGCKCVSTENPGTSQGTAFK